MTSSIAASFVAAQRAFGPALKTATNPHFRSKYADLSAVVEAVIDALNANGIGMLQKTHPCDDGVIVETVFIHESGETLSSGMLHVPASKGDAQGYGSALTYARRYSLMAACGVAPEDDDGNAAARKHTPDSKVLNGAVAQPSSVSRERVAELDDLASYIIERHEAGEDLPAIKAYKELKDNDEKMHLWAALKPYSKLRAAIKANP